MRVNDAGESDRPSREAVREAQRLFLLHIDVIRGFIRALVRDQHLADDVVQETFLTVARKASSFRAGTSFPKWACTIARYKVLEMRRRDSGRLTFLSEEAIDALAESHEPADPDPRLDLIEECVAALPPSMRRLIDLRYMVGRKPSEIARNVGWSPEAVYVTLSRARRAIGDCIRNKLDHAEGNA